MVSWSLLISCLAYRLVVVTVKDCLTDKFCLDKKSSRKWRFCAGNFSGSGWWQWQLRAAATAVTLETGVPQPPISIVIRLWVQRGNSFKKAATSQVSSWMQFFFSLLFLGEIKSLDLPWRPWSQGPRTPLVVKKPTLDNCGQMTQNLRHFRHWLWICNWGCCWETRWNNTQGWK